MCADPTTVRGPVVALPVNPMRRSRDAHAFPPHIAVVGQHHIGEDGVGLAGFHRHRVGIIGGARGDAEEAGFGIDRAQGAVGGRLDPGDVIANRQRLPVAEALGRHDHGQVGLAAGAGERRRDVGFCTLGIFQTQNQHVFGQPAFVASHRRGDPQRQALLAEQGVAAVTGTVGPDFTGFREMNNGLAGNDRFARPRHVFLAGGQRRANRVDARHKETVAAQRLKHLAAHAGHDPHVGDDIGRIGDFDADLGNRAANGTHAERDDVQGAALHAAAHQFFQLRPHFIRRRPVVGRAGIFLVQAANEGAIFNPRHIGRMRAGQIGVGPLFRIQLDKSAGGDHFGAQPLIFLFRTVAPDHMIRLGQGRNFIYPCQQFAGPCCAVVSDCHRWTLLCG